MENEKLIYGKAQIKNIVGLETNPDTATVEIFCQRDDGTTFSIRNPYRYWILCSEKINSRFIRLEGNLHYKWGIQFTDPNQYNRFKNIWKHSYDIYTIHNAEEAIMVKDGYCFYQGLKPKDVSLLSFDIETTGLNGYADDAKIVLISTSFRSKNNDIVNKLFSFDGYAGEAELIDGFCDYVLRMDPNLIIGHNVLTYDLPYLKARAEVNGTKLLLGRNNKEVEFNNYESKFRLDGTRDLLYKNCKIYGREIVDTYFLSVSFDVSKSFESNALKPLIKQLGFEKENRQMYDASQIRFKYKDKEEFEKIKAYAEADAEDPIKLWDYMGATFFYSCQNIPKPLSEVLLSATGSKVNSILVRGYLQDKHSLPKSSEIKGNLEGGISFGVPGVYKNVKKWDISSAYPSQVLRLKLYDKDKDPKAYFYEMVKFFTEKRFYYKKMVKETGLKEWDDLNNTAKLFINSAYGALSTSGLLFNSPENAATITRETRNVINMALKWASGKEADYWLKNYGNKEFEDGGDL